MLKKLCLFKIIILTLRHNSKVIAYQLIGFVKDENIEMVQFHQSYSYEDFVQGIRPSEEGGFERRNGIFSSFEEIRVTEGLLGRLRQHRLSGFYKLVLNICRLIWDSTLPCKDKDGRLEFLDFTEDDFRMDCIFERFLMNFCKQNCRDEYPEVHREYIDFQLSPFGMMFKEAGEALPMMETDVTRIGRRSLFLMPSFTARRWFRSLAAGTRFVGIISRRFFLT